MSKTSAKMRWTLYGIGMILLGLFPFARTFIPFWLSKLVDWIDRGVYGFYIGTMYIDTDAFWLVYLFLMSAPFVIYGIVCIANAFGRTVQSHTLAQSVSAKTVILAALFGVMIGVTLACLAYTLNFPTGYMKYPLDDFCGAVGGGVFYALAVVVLIVYAHARRRPFVKKGFLFEIGVAMIGVLAGAWLLSVAYNFIELWEDKYGYVNALVEWIQK